MTIPWYSDIQYVSPWIHDGPRDEICVDWDQYIMISVRFKSMKGDRRNTNICNISEIIRIVPFQNNLVTNRVGFKL